MGKAVPQKIKSSANLLLKTYPGQLSTDFEANKRFVDSFDMPMSQTQRNLIAGFAARKARQAKKQ